MTLRDNNKQAEHFRDYHQLLEENEWISFHSAKSFTDILLDREVFLLPQLSELVYGYL